MSLFALNLLLTFSWVAITGERTLANFAAGFFLSYLTIAVGQRALPADRRTSTYIERLPAFFGFLGYFFWTIIVANLRMVITTLSPLNRLEPAIVAVPLDVTEPLHITLLANWITLTPGTLSLDVSDEFDTLFVHTIDGGGDIEAFRHGIKHNFERRILKVFG